MARVRKCYQMDKDLPPAISARVMELQAMGYNKLTDSQFVRDALRYCLKNGLPHSQQLDMELDRKQESVIPSLLRS